MKRYWGEFTDDSSKKKEIKPNEIILPYNKAEKLKTALRNTKNSSEIVENVSIENALVTQAVEVMNQTEVLQTLIDTYSNKSGYTNCLLNPCQLIPHVDFPPQNIADLVTDEKFAKPFWFIPPIETKFSRGDPVYYPEINKDIAKSALRKSIAGLLRIAGYNDTSKSCLVLFTDAVEEYIRNILERAHDILVANSRDKETNLDVLILEHAYLNLTQTSLVSLHNYFKNEIIEKNRAGISEFKEVYEEYDKLMKESQNIQKSTFKDDEYINFLDFTGSLPSNSQNAVGNVLNILHLLEVDNNSAGYKDMFEGESIANSTPDEQLNFTPGTPSLE